jgi:hypothetical protein
MAEDAEALEAPKPPSNAPFENLRERENLNDQAVAPVAEALEATMRVSYFPHTIFSGG